MKLFKSLRLFVHSLMLVTAILMLQGCGMGAELLKEVDFTRGLAKEEVIIVGTIELNPKLAKDEQSLKPSGVIDLFGYSNMNKNRCMIQFNSKPVAGNYKSLINPEL